MTDGRFGSWGRPILLILVLTAASYAQPDTVWTFRYHPVAGGDYQPLASFVDATGSVYVAGWAQPDTDHMDAFLLKVSSLGVLSWAKTYSNMTAAGVAMDDSGNVYISGATSGASVNGNICLLKYEPDGDTAWVRTYGETGKDFWALGSIAVDDSGSIYACGAADSAVRILKYRNGLLAGVMSYTLGGYTLSSGEFHVSDNGEVYLVLNVEHPTRWEDWLTVKLSSGGQVLWERYYKDTDSTWEQPVWSHVDSTGNIFVTGIVASRASEAQSSFCTMKMDSLGETLWTRTYNGPENLRDEPGFLMLDHGNVYVAGWSMYQEMGENHAITLVKYDSLGNQIWVSRYGRGDTTADPGYEHLYARPDFCSIGIDESENVYLAGSECHDTIGPVKVLLKYGSQGNLAWIVRRPPLPEEGLHGAIVVLGSAGELYDIGTIFPFLDAGAQRSILVTKYQGR
jgi:hypothetical protein